MAIQISPSYAERDNVTPQVQMSRGEYGDAYAKYCARVKAAKAWRESEGYDQTWKNLRDYYRLKMLAPTTDEDSIAVAIAFATINVIAPSVAISHPKVTVTPRDETLDDTAAIVEAVVNFWWKHNQIHDDFRHAVKDFLVYGHGWLKVGWRYAEKERELTPEEAQAHGNELQQQADQYASENPDMAHTLPTDEEIQDNLPDTAIEVDHDEPFAERVSPFDIFVDPEATSLLDAKWIAQRIVLPLERVKKDKRYTRNRSKLQADGSLRWFNEDQKSNIPEDAGRVTLWEYYDLEEEHLCVFAEQQDVGFLVKPQAFPYTFGQPFVMLRNYEVPDQFYPIGEIEAIMPLQDELNETRSGMVAARRLDVAKFMYKEDALDDQGIDALSSDEPYTAIPIKNDVPMAEAIIPMPRNDVNAELYRQHSETIESDMDRVTGINEYQRGALPEVRRTATEASIIQDAANARAADKLDTVERFASEVSRHLVSLAQSFMTSDQVAVVVGVDGTKVWVPFNRDEIAGEFLFSTEAGSTQPQNETFRRQQASQLLQALGPYMTPPGVPGYINVPDLLANVLREGFGIKNPEKYINLMADQQAMQAQQMAAMQQQAADQGDTAQGDAGKANEPGPEQAQDPQLSGGPQPPPGPGVAPATPESPIAGIPPQLVAQLQGQVGPVAGPPGR